MGKRRFRSWKEAEEAYDEKGRSEAVLSEALRALVLDKKVKWIRKGKTKAALTHPERAHGGIVILVFDGYVSAHYAEAWVNYQLTRFTLFDEGQANIRQIATEIRRQLHEVNERLRAERLKDFPRPAASPGS